MNEIKDSGSGATKQHLITRLSNMLNDILDSAEGSNADDEQADLETFSELWVAEFERSTVRGEQLIFKMLLKMLERLPEEMLTLELKAYRLHGQARLENWNENYELAVSLNQQACQLLQNVLTSAEEAGQSPDPKIELLLAVLQIYQAQYWASLNDADKAEQLALAGLPVAQRYEHKRAEGTAIMVLSGVNYARGAVEEAIEQNQKALVLFQEIGDRLYEAKVYNGLALYLSTRRQYKKALELVNKVIGIRTVLGNSKDLISIYATASNLYYNMGQYQAALDYNQMALTLARQKNANGPVTSYANNTVIILCEMGEFKRATQMAKESLQSLGDSKNLAQRRVTLALLAKAAAGAGEKETAAKATEQVKNLLEEDNTFSNIASEGTFYSHFGQALLYQAQTADDFVEADRCFNKSIENFKKLGHQDYQFLVADVFAKILLEQKIPSQTQLETNMVIAKTLRLWWEILMAQPEKHNEKVLSRVWAYADWLATAKLGPISIASAYEVYIFGLGSLTPPTNPTEKLIRGELLIKVAEVAPQAEKAALLQAALTLLKEGHALPNRQKEVARLLKIS